MLKFHNDAIELSGETGTKLKSEILGKYYPLWWEITSGGPSRNYPFVTTIVEMNAGTGEDYIADADKTILGSSGHALDLKAKNINLETMNVILVEEDTECFTHLLNVIKRNWPSLKYSQNLFADNDTSDVFLLQNRSVIFDIVDRFRLGNSLFFFDPLLYTPWSEIDEVAKKRITSYYETRTEFIVFLFTSDWFSGRGDLPPLPYSKQQKSWSVKEIETITKVNSLFGNDVSWQDHLLTNDPEESKMDKMVELYRKLLHKWFRYVLPMPFAPKPNQIYHLFMCSNYEEGVNITKKFYTKFTGNQSFSPNNQDAYSKFLRLHPEKKLKGTTRSAEWRILWSVIRNHDEGLCDSRCKDLVDIQSDGLFLQESLEWLYERNYLLKMPHFSNNWNDPPQLYLLNWDFVHEKLGIPIPTKLKPLSKINQINTTSTEPQTYVKRDTLERWF